MGVFGLYHTGCLHWDAYLFIQFPPSDTYTFALCDTVGANSSFLSLLTVQLIQLGLGTGSDPWKEGRNVYVIFRVGLQGLLCGLPHLLVWSAGQVQTIGWMTWWQYHLLEGFWRVLGSASGAEGPSCFPSNISLTYCAIYKKPVLLMGSQGDLRDG